MPGSGHLWPLKEIPNPEAEQIMYAVLSQSLIFKLTLGSINVLTPPLIATCEELDRALDIIETYIRT